MRIYVQLLTVFMLCAMLGQSACHAQNIAPAPDAAQEIGSSPPLTIAPAPVLPVLSSHDQKEPDVTVRLRPYSDHIALDYRMPEARSALRLESYNAPSRKDWVVEDGFVFDGELITRFDGADFDRVTLTAKPETRFTNRRYVAIDRIGPYGWTLFLPAFAAHKAETTLYIDGAPSDYVVRVAGGIVPSTGVELDIEPDRSRLIYLGPPDMVDGSLIAGPEIPSWMRGQVREDLTRMLAALEAGFDAPPRTPPSVYMSYNQDFETKGWKGGALADGVIAMRLRGLDLREDDDDLIKSLTGLVAHEAVHIWIGQRYPNRQNAEQSWGHEGAADYIAARLRLSPDEFSAHSAQVLNRCRSEIAGRVLNDPKAMIQGAASYDCGYAVNFMAEAAGLHKSGQDIFDLWRAAFDADEAADYHPDQFRAAARAAGGPVFDDLTAALFDGVTATQDVIPALASIGIDAAQGDPADLGAYMLNQKWLMPLLGALCEGGFGYYDEGAYYKLDTQERCGAALAGDPQVDTLGPYNFMTEPYAAYQYAQIMCGAGADLIFVATDGTALPPVTCTATPNSLAPPLTFTSPIAFPALAKDQ